MLGYWGQAPVNSTQVDGERVSLPESNISHIEKSNNILLGAGSLSHTNENTNKTTHQIEEMDIEHVENNQPQDQAEEGVGEKSKEKNGENITEENMGDDTLYRCPCGKLCQSNRGLSQHKKSCNAPSVSHETSSVVHTCELCNSKFSNSRALTQHKGSKKCNQRLELSRIRSNSLTLALSSSTVSEKSTNEVHNLQYFLIS